MTVWETGIAIGIMLVFLTGFLATQTDILGMGDARLRATALEQLHAGVKGYMRSEYASLEECLGVRKLEEDWNGEGAGGQAGPFKAVRLYPVPETLPEATADHVQALADNADDLACLDPDLGTPRTLSEAGFLPAVLSGLRYEDGSDESSNLWRGLDFRLMIRAVNLTREQPAPPAPPIAAHVGLQAVLVVQGRPGEAMPVREAGGILRAMAIGEGGLLRSVNVGAALAEQTIAGRGGGWRMEVCDAGITVTYLEPCGISGPASQRIPVEADSSGSPVRRAFISGKIDGQRVSGSTGGRATARVVTVASIGRDEALRDVMFRVHVGIPEANRMESDIDMGAYGLLNVSYITGIDIDGDGLVDRGVGLAGPSRGHEEESRERRRRPVTVYGDLYVRGALHVGAGIDWDPDDDDDVVDDFDTNIPPGSIWAQGGVQAGAAVAAANLPAGALFAHKGVQVGGGNFEMPLKEDPDAPDETPPVFTAPYGSLWVRGAAQIGAVGEGEEATHDPAIPVGALLTGGEIRSSAGVRAVGPEIVLAASAGDLTRAGPSRGWEALALGLGKIADDDPDRGLLEDPDDADAVLAYYAGEGGRIQFRTEGDGIDEGDGLRMVTDAGTLKVMPVSVADPPVNPYSLRAWQGDVGIEAVDDGLIVLDEVDVWVEEQSRTSRSLHAALPRYVSQDFSLESNSPVEWREKDDPLVAEAGCPGEGVLRKVLITMAWSRKYMPREPRQIWTSNYLRMPITDWQPRPNYVMEPYTGWSVNSVTGIDNGIGPTTPEEPFDLDDLRDPHHSPEFRSHGENDREKTTSFTRNYYCDYSAAADTETKPPLGEQQNEQIRDLVMRVYPDLD